MQTGTECEKEGIIKFLTRRVANWYEWWRNKTEQKENKKSQCKIKHSLFLACAYRETDARGQFAEHKRSELLEVKPRALLASRALSKLPVWIHNTIYTRQEHEPIIL